MSNLFFYFGIRQLIEKPVRSALIMLGISFGIALFIAIRILNQATMDSFKSTIEAVAGKAALTVSMGETGFPDTVMDVVRKVPGVHAAVPLVEARGTYVLPDKTSQTLMVLGIDMLKEQSVRSYEQTDGQVISDPLLFLNQADSIIITETFAAEHGLKEDSKFDLMTAHGVKTFTVRGLLKAKGPALAYGGAIAIMDIDGARVSFGKGDKLDRIDVIEDNDNVNTDELAVRLRKTLGEAYTVEGPEGQLDIMGRMVSSYQALLTLFSFLALLAGLFLIANCVSISVSERRKEIGTLRALGSKKSSIFILLMLEAMVMGLIGSFIGAFIGRGLASILLKRVQDVMANQYQTQIDMSHLTFGARDVAVAVVIGGVASCVAAVWPARQAMAISPLEAIRQNESDEHGSPSRLMKRGSILGAIMLMFLVVSSILQFSARFQALEILNQTCAMIGAAFVSPFIVTTLVRIVRPIALKLGGLVPTLAAGNLLRNPGRTGGNVMTLMIGLIFVVNIAAMNTSFRNTIVDWFTTILREDIIVSSGSLLSNSAQPLHEEVGTEIAAIPGIGVGKNEPGVFASRSVHFKYQGESLTLNADDEPARSQKYNWFEVTDRTAEKAGYDLYHSYDPVVMVSQNFVVHFKKKTGDTIEIPTPQGPVKMKIVGVMVDWSSPAGSVLMSREQYKKFWHDPLVTTFYVYAKPGVDVGVIRKDIDSRLGASHNLNVLLASEFRKQMETTVDQSFSYTINIEAAALLVGLLGLLNAMIVSVMERTRELGMLRAIGMTSRQVRRMTLFEALYLGGFGALGAAALGCCISYLWITYSLTTVLGWVVTFSLPTSALITVVLTGIIVAIGAGIYPAYYATKIAIREALTYE